MNQAPEPLSEAPAPSHFSVLKKRAEFIAASRARRWAAKGMVVQGRRRRDGEAAETPIRVGYTCSKKVGNAVARNRAKRRLRAAAADVIPRCGLAGWDYVLIGKAEATAARPFTELCGDLEYALSRIHAPKPKKP